MRATKAHQRKKVDRFFIKKDDVVVHIVDYKVDRRAAETQNLALEHISVKRGADVQARGWLHTSSATQFVYYVPAWDRVLVFRTDELRNRLDDIQRLFPLKPCRTDKDQQGRLLAQEYETWSYCVPVNWLRQNGLIHKELNAVGAQLRLRLRVR